MFLRRLPLLAQLDGYDRSIFRSDLAAGITVGVMLIPQGMAYALIAGVPPVYGLYASLVPLVLYALFGSSRQLAVGPVAIVALLVATAVAPLAEGDPQRYVELTLLLALMVGIIQLAMGLLRFGFLTNVLSRPVLAGFTSAAALIIGASQLRHLFGMALPQTNHVHEILAAIVRGAGSIDPLTLAVGGGGIILLLGLGRLNRALPGALILVAVAGGISWLAGLEDAGLATVGTVPGGLPVPALPPLDPRAAAELLPAALTIALLGFMESIAVAKVVAARHRYDVDADRELVGLGLANLVGSFFRAFPVAGGFSRTAVNEQAGARTGVATLVAAGIVGFTLLFLTGLFQTLPDAALAAIVLVAVSRLIDWREARQLWRVDRRDFAMMTVTFGATLAVGIEAGIITGVAASLIALIYDTSRPHTAVLGRLPGTETYRNLLRHPSAEPEPGVTILRVDSALCFANAEFMRDRVRMLVEPPRQVLPAMEAEDQLRVLILDFHAVNGLDSTALHQLEEILHDLEGRGVLVRFAGVKGPVMDRLRRGEVDRKVGLDRFHHEVSEAVRMAVEEIEGGTSNEGEGESTQSAGERKTASNSRRGMAGSSPSESRDPSGSRATSSS
jgi:sulfate permease, SulP family